MALSSHSESKSHIVTSSVQYPFQYPGKSYQEHHDTSSTQTARVLEHSKFLSHSEMQLGILGISSDNVAIL